MPAMVHISARLIPWDDPGFVKSFEHARDEIAASGCCPEGPAAAEQVQQVLRERGYPAAVIEVERSVSEALEHTSHWSVRRDG